MPDVFVKPAMIDGQPARVRDPNTFLVLKAEGEWKERTAYWERRLRDGDVVEAQPPAAIAAAFAYDAEVTQEGVRKMQDRADAARGDDVVVVRADERPSRGKSDSPKK